MLNTVMNELRTLLYAGIKPSIRLKRREAQNVGDAAARPAAPYNVVYLVDLQSYKYTLRTRSWLFCLAFVVLGTEPGASCMQALNSTSSTLILNTSPLRPCHSFSSLSKLCWLFRTGTTFLFLRLLFC